MQRTLITVAALVGLAHVAHATNFLIVIADDLGVDKVRAYTSTAEEASAAYLPQTPTLDQLAASGLTFTAAWAHPVCSPTRASLLTGNYAFNHGLGAVVGQTGVPELDLSYSTVADELAANGYATAMFGKWHLGETGVGGLNRWRTNSSCPTVNTLADQARPIGLGFEYFNGSLRGEPEDYTLWNDVESSSSSATSSICRNATYPDTWHTDEALLWIDSQVASGRDWFAVVSLNSPHTDSGTAASGYEENDLDPTCASYAGLPACLQDGVEGSCDFDGDGVTGATDADDSAAENRYIYGAMVACLDEDTGELLQGLDDIDQARGTAELADTVVIFLGDNGTPPGVMEAPFLRSGNYGKGTTYETGIKVPLIVADGEAWLDVRDGVAPTSDIMRSPGRTVARNTLDVDFYDTLLQMAGITPVVTTDGESFASCLTNTTSNCGSIASRRVYSESFAQNAGATYEGTAAYRKNNNKLIMSYNSTRRCMTATVYNIVTDPYEATGLTTGATVTSMKADMNTWRSSGGIGWMPQASTGYVQWCL